MKRLFFIIAALLATDAARADLTIRQKTLTWEQSIESTVALAEGKMRTDHTMDESLGPTSVIEMKSGNCLKIVTLVHNSKTALIQWVVMPDPQPTKPQADPAADVPDFIKPLMDEAKKGKVPTLATGRREKIGEYETEIYNWNSDPKNHLDLWIATDFPNYRRINEEHERLLYTVYRKCATPMGPDRFGLPGMEIRSKGIVFGSDVETTLVSASLEPVPASQFEIPAGYEVQEQAQLTPEQQEACKQDEIEAKKVAAALAEGAIFPEFDVKDLAGQPLSLVNYKGKLVILDFWATWCGPCVKELPNLLKVYNQHHGQGLEVIGISLDEDEAALKAFLKEKQIPWPQFFDGKGWENQLAQKYGIRSVPATFLLDGQGRILAKGLRGQNLEQAVTKALGKDQEALKAHKPGK